MPSPRKPVGITPTTPETGASAAGPKTVAAPVQPLRGPIVLPPPTDRYELGEEIARGGMGAVHRARDRNLNRELALKVLLERFVCHAPVIARFVEEALIGGQLQHPGLVPVHELGTLPDGRPFIALKLIKGRTLSAILAERRSPAEDLPLRLDEFKQVCRAVGYAHEHRVIHRDLKPSNVMVGKHGEVQVMDWGVAKMLTASAPEPEPVYEPASATSISPPRSGENSNTQAGDVLGTPSYMAPEQARGQVADVTERSDVFGLGAILCELLTGQPPYPGKTRDACRVLSLVADLGPVEDRLDACGADPTLVDLAKRCLALDPADRPADAGAVADEIEAHLAGVQERLEEAEVARAAAQVRAREERKRRRVQLALLAAVFGIAAACGGGFALVREQRAARAAQNAQLANEATVRMESLLMQAVAAPIDDPAQRERAAALWRDALGAADQAEQFAAGLAPEPRGRLSAQIADARARAADADKHREMLAAIEDARDGKAEIDDNDWNRMLARTQPRAPFFFSANGLPRYARAFSDYGIEIETLSVEAAAGRIEASPIASRLVAALDDWYMVQPDGKRTTKLLLIASRADPDPVRKRIRDAILRDDRRALEGIAEAFPDLAPQTALLLAFGLEEFKDLTPSAAVLERTVRKYPEDFWLQNAFGLYCGNTRPPRYPDSARAALAALAIRPNSHVALVNVGDTLANNGRYDEAIEYTRRAIELRPDLAYIHAKLIHHCGSANRVRDAVRAAETARQRFPNSFTVQLMLGNVYAAAQRWTDAEAAYRRGLQINWDHAALHLALTQLYLNRGRTEDAESSLADAQRVIGFSPYDRIQMAQLTAALGRVEEALTELAAVATVAPEWPDLWATRSQVLFSAGRSAEAVEAARKAVRINPYNPYYAIGLSTVLRHSGESKEALELARAAARAVPNYTAAHTEVGFCLFNLYRFTEAVDAFRLAVETDRSNAFLWTNLGRAQRMTGDAPSAVEALTAAVLLDPDLAEAHRELGLALRAAGQPDAAQIALNGSLSAYREKIRRFPRWSFPHNELGLALAELGRNEEALAEYKAALELSPNDPVIQGNYALLLARMNRTAEAEAAYRALLLRAPAALNGHSGLFDVLYRQGAARRADALFAALLWTAADPNSAAAHNSFGNVLWASRVFDRAVSEYQRATELAPGFAVFHDNLGGALESVRRYGDAARAHRRAWELAPNSGYFAGRLLRALVRANNLDEAEKTAAVALARLPNDAAVHAGVAALRTAQKDPDRAEAELRLALKLDPMNGFFYAELGHLLETLARPREAVEAYRNALFRGHTDAVPQLATVLMAIGNPSEAVAVTDLTLRGHPNEYALLRVRGRAKFDLRNLAAARADLSAALKAAEGRTDITADDRAMTLVWLGHAQYLGGRFADALASARAAERLAPGPGAANAAAHLAADAISAIRCEAVVNTGAPLRPKDLRDRIAVATYLTVADREPAQAYELFREALDADPKFSADRSELHRYNAARAAARAAVETGAESAGAAAIRARAFEWLTGEWASTPPGVRGRRAGIWLRDPALALLRDEAAMESFTWPEWCAWQLFWTDVLSAIE
jgi:tetratricopeptide (TPR) repeat protein